MSHTFSMSKTPSKALIILNESVKSAPVQLSDLEAQVKAELQILVKMEAASAMRALRFGIVMHHIKAKLKHGEFQPWIAKTFAGRGYRQCNYYMRLAIAFVDTMRLNEQEVFALPGAQLELTLDVQDSTTRAVIEKAAKFIGEHSLTELLIKYDIKSVGLKKELDDAKNAESDESALPLEEQIRRRRELVYGETTEHLSFVRKTLTSPEQLQLLEPSQLDTIEQELVELRAEIAKVRKPSA